MRRILGPALVAALLHALLLGGYVAAFGGDPAALVCVGKERMGRAPYEEIHLGFEKCGYDGQFYYALARDPWRPHASGLDFAAFRHLRILYPAAGWLLSGGDARLLLWVLPLVNLLAIAGLAGLGAMVARDRGLSPWWGVLLPLAVNAGLVALRDLTDVVAALAVCGLLVTWLRRGPWWALALWSAAALLSREQNLVVVLAVGLGAAWRRDLRACLGLGGAVALWGAWVAVLWQTYGTWPLLPNGELFGAPLAGMWTRLSTGGEAHRRLLHALCIALVLAEVGLALYLLRFRPDGVVALATAAGAATAVLGGYVFYQDYWSYMRVFALLPLGVWLLSAQARWRAPLLLLSAQALLPLATVARALLRGAGGPP
jgi:hypothetical protein